LLPRVRISSTCWSFFGRVAGPTGFLICFAPSAKLCWHGIGPTPNRFPPTLHLFATGAGLMTFFRVGVHFGDMHSGPCFSYPVEPGNRFLRPTAEGRLTSSFAVAPHPLLCCRSRNNPCRTKWHLFVVLILAREKVPWQLLIDFTWSFRIRTASPGHSLDFLVPGLQA